MTPVPFTKQLIDNTFSRDDPILAHGRRLAEARAKIIEERMIALCPPNLTTEYERLLYLEQLNISIHKNDNMQRQSEEFSIGGRKWFTLTLEVANENDATVMRWVVEQWG